jgi:hypothetical protein
LLRLQRHSLSHYDLQVVLLAATVQCQCHGDASLRRQRDAFPAESRELPTEVLFRYFGEPFS